LLPQKAPFQSRNKTLKERIEKRNVTFSRRAARRGKKKERRYITREAVFLLPLFNGVQDGGDVAHTAIGETRIVGTLTTGR